MRSGREHGLAVLALSLSPLAIWALHFLATYVTAAVYCAKTDSPAAGIIPVRWIVVVLTIAALAAVALTAGLLYRRLGPATPESWRAQRIEGDTSRFLRVVLVWTSVLSAVAIICVASVAFVFGNCR